MRTSETRKEKIKTHSSTPMNILQKDIEIHRIDVGCGQYEYQLIIQGDPCKAVPSGDAFACGLVNIGSEGSIHLELYRNNDIIPDTDFNDPNTYIVPITIKS